LSLKININKPQIIRGGPKHSNSYIPEIIHFLLDKNIPINNENIRQKNHEPKIIVISYIIALLEIVATFLPRLSVPRNISLKLGDTKGVLSGDKILFTLNALTKTIIIKIINRIKPVKN